MKAKTQKEAILYYLQRGYSVTPMNALQLFGCFRLSAVIFALKKDGHNIATKDVKFKSRFGFTGRYASYKIVK